MFHALAVTV